jgi:hypothetical protein
MSATSGCACSVLLVAPLARTPAELWLEQHTQLRGRGATCACGRLWAAGWGCVSRLPAVGGAVAACGWPVEPLLSILRERLMGRLPDLNSQ